MNRILLGLLMVLTCSTGCGSRTISLEEGLRNTQAGNYNLVAVSDHFISFQVDAWHKHQFYGDPASLAAALPHLEQALAAASKAGHPVAFVDARNNTTAQPAVAPADSRQR